MRTHFYPDGGNKITIGTLDENTVLKEWYAANGFIRKGIEQFGALPFTIVYMEWSDCY
jgi:hypothetical protein